MKSPYPENWQEIAYQAKHRYSFTCQCCNRNAIDQPGINLNSQNIDLNPLNNNIDNLLPLCQACHLRLHEVLSPQLRHLKNYFIAISKGQKPLDFPQELTPHAELLTQTLIGKLTKEYINK